MLKSSKLEDALQNKTIGRNKRPQSRGFRVRMSLNSDHSWMAKEIDKINFNRVKDHDNTTTAGS